MPTMASFDFELATRRTVRTPAAAGVRSCALVLAVLGLIASVPTLLIYNEVIRTQVSDLFNLVREEPVKPASYYLWHAAECLFLTAAGVISLATIPRREIQIGYRMRFGLLVGAAVVMAAKGYTLSDVLSTKLVHISGPFPYFISALVFVGAPRANWRVLSKVIESTSILFSGLVLLTIARLQSVSRNEASVSLGLLLGVLYWTGAWVALRSYAPRSAARHFRFVPIGIFALASVLTQTRLNFVLVIALLAVYGYVQHRRGIRQVPAWIAALCLALWLAIFAQVFLRDTGPFQKLETAAIGLESRLDEDTRTDQLVWFLRSVQPQELLLGRGAFATWDWGTITGYAWGTDVGYLSMLFFGGLPLLVTYVAVHVAPGISALRRPASDLQLTAGGVVVLWGIALFSSASAGMTLQYYPVLLCVGACISRESSLRAPALSYTAWSAKRRQPRLSVGGNIGELVHHATQSGQTTPGLV